MAGFNGMGPANSGPMSGRGLGNCVGNEEATAGYGMGGGFGCRAGRGLGGRGGNRNGRRGASANFNSSTENLNSPNSTINSLKSQKEFYEKRLKSVDDAINNMPTQEA